MRSRIFNIMQYEKHPESGEKLLDEKTIKRALEHRGIKQWAYVCHDSDTYTPSDEKKDKKHTAGTLKPRHYHIVLNFGAASQTVETVARWFGIAANFVAVPKGRGAFLDCVEYLTHESEEQQAAGKHLYDDSKIHACFDFRKELTARNERRAKFGTNISEKEELRYKVLYEGLTLRQICDSDPLAYQRDYSTLEKFRMRYITERQEMPQTRINYYVCGSGGIGKGLICKAIARALYPNLTNDDDIFFCVGAKGAAFDGYDGQPVIIWDDRRGHDLLQELGGRGNVFNIFDTHPIRQRQNVKYASICLCNKVNLINSVQDYTEFMDEIVAEYKDASGKLVKSEQNEKGQILRRFPFIIPLHEKDFDIMMNRGVFEGSREYEQYIEYKALRGSMREIAQKCEGNAEALRLISMNTVEPIIEKHVELESRLNKPTKSTADLLAEFDALGFGKPIQQGEVGENDETATD